MQKIFQLLVLIMIYQITFTTNHVIHSSESNYKNLSDLPGVSKCKLFGFVRTSFIIQTFLYY